MPPPVSTLQSGQRLALLGVFINLVLAAVKIVAGVVGHAYALIADGVESLLDVGGSLVIWSGLRLASKPPDEEHPYGHGKAEPLAAGLVALLVLVAALGLAIESIREIIVPHHAPKPFTLVVLIVVMVIKEALYRTVISKAEESTAMKTDAWHHRMDAITSLAAFVGISVALIGGPGYEAADDYAALAACGLIAFNGFHLLMPAVYEVMDTAPAPELLQTIRDAAQAVDGVRGIDKCYVRKMGFEYYVDIHVRVDGTLTVTEGHQIAHAVKDRLREVNPAIRDALVHIEPAYPV
jgi:cation diffusion facilitator family transporter